MANTYLDHDIPEGRKKLIECNENLIGIAQYCEQNYAQSNDKREALGTTRVCFSYDIFENFYALFRILRLKVWHQWHIK